MMNIQSDNRINLSGIWFKATYDYLVTPLSLNNTHKASLDDSNKVTH